MIVEPQIGLVNGFRACIEAAIHSRCQSYFASPTPLHAQLVNEGAKRFLEVHGTFVQAGHPVEALSMAKGVARTGSVPLLSCSYDDFLALQQGLQELLVHQIPCVLAVLLYQQPFSPGDSPLAYPYPCFLNPWPAGGLPLLNLLPSSLGQAEALTKEAFVLARRLQQPVLVLLDPILMTVTGALQASLPEPLPALEPSALNSTPLQARRHLQSQLQSWSGRWLQQWQSPEPPTYALVATGALGGWLLSMEWPQGRVLVPESLFPLGLEREAAHNPKLPWVVVEFAPGGLCQQLQQRFPHQHIRQLELPWQRHFPVGLQTVLLEALQQQLQAVNPYV